MGKPRRAKPYAWASHVVNPLSSVRLRNLKDVSTSSRPGTTTWDSIRQPTRRCRSGQLPPLQPQQRRQPGGAADDDQHAEQQQHDDHHYQGTQQPTGDTYEQRVQQRAANWQKYLARHQQDYVQHYPRAVAARQRERHAHQGSLQADVHTAWKLHACCRAGDSITDGCLEYQDERTVTYFGLPYQFQLVVRRWKCTACQEDVTASPLQYGCFPSTPVVASMWYDMQVHEMYRRYAVDGMAATGFLSGLHDIHGRWDAACVQVQTKHFEDSFCAFLAVTTHATSLSALGVTGLDTGFFSDCPICSEGCPVHPSYQRTVSADAVTKLGHYSSAGTASLL